MRLTPTPTRYSVVCSGDVNKLDLGKTQLSFVGSQCACWLPNTGNSCLDNVFTNRKYLFGKWYPFLNMLIKTDYSAVIVPPGLKLKPIHSKISIRDRREHRKISLIHGHMDSCYSWQWMSPLVKSRSLLKTKARISSSNSDRLRHLNESISQLISASENRRRLLTAPTR